MNKLIVKLDDKIIENFESTDGILLIKGGVNKENSDFAELNNVCNAHAILIVMLYVLLKILIVFNFRFKIS